MPTTSCYIKATQAISNSSHVLMYTIVTGYQGVTNVVSLDTN